MKEYPFSFRKTIDDISTVLEKILQNRREDIGDFNNLPNRFIRGRRVERIPTSSTDVLPEDSVNDINSQPDYLYILVDVSGTLEWRRIAQGVF